MSRVSAFFWMVVALVGCKDEPPSPPTPATQYWPGQDLTAPKARDVVGDPFTPATGIPANKGKGDLEAEVKRLEGEIAGLENQAKRTPSQARAKQIQKALEAKQAELGAVKAEIARRQDGG